MILGLFTLACKHRFPLVASVLWNVVHFLYFSFHFTTFQHFISQTPAWEARQVFTWNQSWETKLVCEVNIFTSQNPIPTGASNWPLLVLIVEASSLLSDQGAWGKLFLCVFLQLVFLPEPTKETSNYPWGRHPSTAAPKGALFVESCASPLSLHRRLRQSMGACQRPANFSNQLISPCLVTQCCWRHSPLPFHKQHHTGVAGTTVFGGGRISSPPWGKMGPLSERRGWLMSRNLFETV